jgi:hypothetical protein
MNSHSASTLRIQRTYKSGPPGPPGPKSVSVAPAWLRDLPETSAKAVAEQPQPDPPPPPADFPPDEDLNSLHIPDCKLCGGGDVWWNALGKARCLHCDPPSAAARSFLVRARALRRQYADADGETPYQKATPLYGLIGRGHPPIPPTIPPDEVCGQAWTWPEGSALWG